MSGPPALMPAGEALAAYLGGLLSDSPQGAGSEHAPAASVLDAPPAITPSAAPADTAVPWGEGERRQCLLFRVAAVTLAVPLIGLAEVLPCPARVTRLPRMPPGLAGLFRNRERQVALVDTLHLLSLGPGPQPWRYALVLEGGRWALACHALGGTRVLGPAQVQWRPRREQRPWLLGRVREGLQTVVDGAELARWLESVPTRHG
jgi:purine-binding chemotaxis protein CheW